MSEKTSGTVRQSRLQQYNSEEYAADLVKRVALRSGMRCECVGHCGMNHKEQHHVDGRCGLKNFGQYKMPTQNPVTGKWHKIPVTIVLGTVHVNHDRADFSFDNIMVFCQACRLLHESNQAWQ